MQFLDGLNDQYNNVKALILSMKQIPSIAKKISFLVQQECPLNNNVLVVNEKT